MGQGQASLFACCTFVSYLLLVLGLIIFQIEVRLAFQGCKLSCWPGAHGKCVTSEWEGKCEDHTATYRHLTSTLETTCETKHIFSAVVATVQLASSSTSETLSFGLAHCHSQPDPTFQLRGDSLC